jgi:2-(1,2-epoxy-1,2-dihydrophenyl)acetyl-CoA isomerase
MAESHVHMACEDGIAVITLDNPARRNALGRPMQARLRELLAGLRRDAQVRCVVLTARGSEAFCAGADLNGDVFTGDAETSRGTQTAAVMRELSNPLIVDLMSLPVPVVVALNGIAAGAGVGLALAADVIVAARSSAFYLPFIPKLGIVPDLGTTWFLERLLGRSRAVALTLLGDRLPAAKAEQWGLVWACVDDDGLMPAAMEIARRMAALPHDAVLETRRAYDHAHGASLAEQLDYEAARQQTLIDRPEFDEGVRAFLEKRAPRFVPRATETRP